MAQKKVRISMNPALRAAFKGRYINPNIHEQIEILFESGDREKLLNLFLQFLCEKKRGLYLPIVENEPLLTRVFRDLPEEGRMPALEVMLKERIEASRNLKQPRKPKKPVKKVDCFAAFDEPKKPKPAAKPKPTPAPKKSKPKTEYAKRKRARRKFYRSEAWRSLRSHARRILGDECCNCSSKEKPHVDHIKPRSLHPKMELDIRNVQILCEVCNLDKGNKHDTDFRTDAQRAALQEFHPKWMLILAEKLTGLS